MSKLTIPALRTEQCALILALSGMGIVCSLAVTYPNDFWWHLKAGQIIATSGLPQTNLFAWTLPTDAPYVYQSWLGEWLFYALYWLGGLQLVIFSRNLLWILALSFVALETLRRTKSGWLAAGVVLVAGFMAINNLTTRTQNWSWLPFTLLLYLLGGYVAKQFAPRWLGLLPLLMLFWVNAHGAFITGILLTTAFVVGETLSFLLHQPNSLAWERLRLLYLAFGAMLFITIVNPLGLGIFAYLKDLLTDPPSQSLVVEWASPTPRSEVGKIFYGTILALLIAFSFARRRPTISEIILICGFSWMAFSGIRYVVWFGFAALPILAHCLVKPSLEPKKIELKQPKLLTTLNFVITVCALIGFILVQPWFKTILPWPKVYLEQFAALPEAPLLFSKRTPVKATEHLRVKPCQGPLFNQMGYGSYLSWALYPQTQVFIDSRVELYPLSLWHAYLRLSEGQDVAKLLQKYAISCVMLELESQEPLSVSLSQMPEWKRTFSNEDSEVWRRGKSYER